MSKTAPWLALACDWHESEMLIAESAGVKLVWIALLSTAKSRGRGGVFQIRPSVICRDYGVALDDVSRLLQVAVEHDAIRLGENDTVTLVNWSTYQDPRQRRGSKVTEPDVSVKDHQFTKKSPTHHTSPTTHHQPQESDAASAASAPTARKRRSKAAAPDGLWGDGEIRLCTQTWRWHGITAEHRGQWSEACPAVDIDVELAKAALWCRDEGGKGRKQNYRRFLTKWLARTQERGGNGRAAVHVNGVAPMKLGDRWAAENPDNSPGGRHASE